MGPLAPVYIECEQAKETPTEWQGNGRKKNYSRSGKDKISPMRYALHEYVMISFSYLQPKRFGDALQGHRLLVAGQCQRVHVTGHFLQA